MKKDLIVRNHCNVSGEESRRRRKKIVVENPGNGACRDVRICQEKREGVVKDERGRGGVSVPWKGYPSRLRGKVCDFF